MTTVSEFFLKRDYPEHVCPPEIERHGDRRSGYHGGGFPAELDAVCLRQTACGCAVTGNGTLQHPVMIEPCSAHREAMYPTVQP